MERALFEGASYNELKQYKDRVCLLINSFSQFSRGLNILVSNSLKQGDVFVGQEVVWLKLHIVYSPFVETFREQFNIPQGPPVKCFFAF